MLKNYLKISIRNILKHKTFSSINILGFALGISVCLLIVVFLIKEYSYDLYNSNVHDIYRLVDMEKNSTAIDYRVASVLARNYPEIKNTCVVSSCGKTETSYHNAGYFIDHILSVDNAFFQMFTVRFISGNAAHPLPNPHSVVLTESGARKIFGNDNPLGKEIIMWRQIPLTVTGVIKDFPETSSIVADMMVNMDNSKFRFSRSDVYGQDGLVTEYYFNIFLQLNKNAAPEQLVKTINAHPDMIQPHMKKAGLLALKDMYFDTNTAGGINSRGNPDIVKLFAVIALIVLLLAITNYINLCIAQQHRRNKETGIRKTIGAGRKDIVVLFLTESVLVTAAAFGIALVIAEVTLPLFGEIVDTHLNMNLLLHMPYVIVLPAAVLLIGIGAGLIPAMLFSSYSPIRMIRNRITGLHGRNYFGNILTVFQFTVSIALVFCVIVVEKQINYVKHENLGFDKEQLLRIDLPVLNTKEDMVRVDALKNKLRDYSGILNVCLSQGVPGNVTSILSDYVDHKDRQHYCINTDSSFLSTFKIQLIKGRMPLPGQNEKTCLINETERKRYDWQKANNKIEYFGPFSTTSAPSTYINVIGVVKDFHISSLHRPIEPACIIFTSDFTPDNISLRIRQGDIPQTMEYLQNAWREVFPDSPLNYQFYDEWFDQMYRQDERFGDAIILFAFLALCISCLGILGLATFASERRTKEIGIRKVHGASVLDVMVLLNREFMKWVVMALAIACPIGWYAMDTWLQNFAYRTDMSWWLYALSGAIALFTAFLAISIRTWRASTANPVESLRYE